MSGISFFLISVTSISFNNRVLEKQSVFKNNSKDHNENKQYIQSTVPGILDFVSFRGIDNLILEKKRSRKIMKTKNTSTEYSQSVGDIFFISFRRICLDNRILEKQSSISSFEKQEQEEKGK